MIIVEIKGYSDRENIEYLKYNGYGKIIHKTKENTYFCLGGTKKYIELCDVEIKRIAESLLLNYISQNELFNQQYK